MLKFVFKGGIGAPAENADRIEVTGGGHVLLVIMTGAIHWVSSPESTKGH